MGSTSTQKETKHNILRAIDAVAARLGNTRAVCRKYYIHPALLQAYEHGLTAAPSKDALPRKSRKGPSGAALRIDEVAILQFLQDLR